MTKGIQNIVKQVSSQWVRKTKYAANPTFSSKIPTQTVTSLRRQQSTSIGSKTQEMIQKLSMRFTTESKKIKIDGVERDLTIFKGSQSGSNQGFWVIDKTNGHLGYAKFGNEAQMRSEKLASELYQLTGAKTPKISLISERIPAQKAFSSDNEKIGVISCFLPIEDITPTQAKLLREDFGADCWLANWDALKKGNVGIYNGQAVRMDVGGSLCYRAQGARKGIAFGEDVQELTTFFDNYSLSRPYLKDMTKSELFESLRKVTKITDDDIIKLIDNNAYTNSYGPYWDMSSRRTNFGMRTTNTGIQNPEYLKEILISRKNYISNFLQKCESTPQKTGETIEEYIRRVTSTIPETKHHIPFEKIELSSRVGQEVKGLTLAETLTPSQKKLYEESLAAFQSSAKQKIIHQGVDDILTTDCMLHSTGIDALESIFEKGFTPGEIRPISTSGTGQDTLTTLCSDFWDVRKSTKIKDYFSRQIKDCADGELNFLPNSNKGTKGLAIVVNKQKVNSTIMKNSFIAPEAELSILNKDGIVKPHLTYETHRIVPIGVPSNAIDRIIISPDKYSALEQQKIQKMITKSGLDIKIFDTNGTLLWKPTVKTENIISSIRKEWS